MHAAERQENFALRMSVTLIKESCACIQEESIASRVYTPGLDIDLESEVIMVGVETYRRKSPTGLRLTCITMIGRYSRFPFLKDSLLRTD